MLNRPIIYNSFQEPYVNTSMNSVQTQLFFHPDHLPSQRLCSSSLQNGDNHTHQLLHKDIVRINEHAGKHVSALDECFYINANDCIIARLPCTNAMTLDPQFTHNTEKSF